MGVLIDRIARQSKQRAHEEWHDRIRAIEARERRNGYRYYDEDGGEWLPLTVRERLVFAGIILGGSAAFLGMVFALMWMWR